MNWQIVYNSGLLIRDNPDYPILFISTSFSDINELINQIENIFKRRLRVKKIVNIESNADSRGSHFLTIEVEEDDKSIINPIFWSISEIDGVKIRIFINPIGTKTEIRIIPIINPRFDLKKCNVDSVLPQKCLYKSLKLDRSEKICGLCLPISVNEDFLDTHETFIISELRNMGTIIKSHKITSPKYQRYL